MSDMTCMQLESMYYIQLLYHNNFIKVYCHMRVVHCGWLPVIALVLLSITLKLSYNSTTVYPMHAL